MKVELKKYVARHEQYLGEEKEWKDLCVRYGLIKDESRGKECCQEEEEEEEFHGQREKETMEGGVASYIWILNQFNNFLKKYGEFGFVMVNVTN